MTPRRTARNVTRRVLIAPALGMLLVCGTCLRAQPGDVVIHPASGRGMYPALIERGGALLAAWLGFGADTTAFIDRVETDGGLHGVLVDSLPIRQGTQSTGALRNSFLDVRNAGGEAVLRDVTDWAVSSPAGTRRQQYAHIAFASADGWVDMHLLDSSGEPALTLDHISSQHDANTGSSLHAVGYRAGAGATFVRAGVYAPGATEPGWTTEISFEPRQSVSVIPTTGKDFVLGSAQDGVPYHGGIRDSAISWDAFLPDVRFLRLRGTHLLRWSGGNSQLNITLLDTGLATIHAHQLTVPGVLSLDGIAIVENPRDRNLIVIMATQEGIMGQVLDPALEPVGGVVRISKGRAACTLPSAAIRNDSLFVIWQDARTGLENVYMNVMPLAVADVPPRSGGAGQGVPSIRPLPAGDNATVILSAPLESDAVVTLFDGFGVAAGTVRIAAGERSARIDTRRLASGIYTVAVGGLRTGTRLVVLH